MAHHQESCKLSDSHKQELRIGLAGLGTVGKGVVKLLSANGPLIDRKSDRRFSLRAVSARDPMKDRGVALEDYDWEDDPVRLATRSDIDIFVELIGGENGVAYDAVKAALTAGKDVVTANKALLAHHGMELSQLAENNHACIRFEAAVVGGVPVVKALTEGLASNRISRVFGVMNGTCNYILTRMESERLSYETVFNEAHDLGYLEADPTLDVGGIDAGHKLALLSSIAFGTQVDFANMDIEGIERISIRDIEQASDMGYRIKLLGIAKLSRNGLEQRTQPCLVPRKAPLGQIEGATNLVVLEGDFVGKIYLQGPGAGEGPTASAVVADVIDLARGIRLPTFGQRTELLIKSHPTKAAEEVPYYIRLMLVDKPGVLAKIAGALGSVGISINRMKQYDHSSEIAPVTIVTHKTTRDRINKALNEIDQFDVSVEKPFSIRIEEV